MGTDRYESADAFELAYILKHKIESMLQQSIPVIMLTDSDFVFKTLIKNKTTNEKPLMLDIAGAREAYSSHEIIDIGWIQGDDDPAYRLKTSGRCKPLETFLNTKKLNIPTQQWII